MSWEFPCLTISRQLFHQKGKGCAKAQPSACQKSACHSEGAKRPWESVSLKVLVYRRNQKNRNILENGLPRQRVRWLAMTGFSTVGEPPKWAAPFHYARCSQ